MCALVSEVCHADLASPVLEAWSSGNVHWRECWQAERRGERVLGGIQPLVLGECWQAERRGERVLESIKMLMLGERTEYQA